MPACDCLIMTDDRSHKSDSNGPFNEGAHLTLVCEAEGGEYTHTYSDSQVSPADQMC